MKNLIKSIIKKACFRIVYYANLERIGNIYKMCPGIDRTVQFDKLEVVGNNVFIGCNTYINDGCTLSSGKRSKIVIGKYCAIGRFVHIAAKTHSLTQPTNNETSLLLEEETDVQIGDYVWIGDKVYIKPGVSIGNHAIIATNAVVIKNVHPFEIVGGIPAKHIRFNEEDDNFSTFGKDFRYNTEECGP